MLSKKSQKMKKKRNGRASDLELEKRKTDEIGEDLGIEEWTNEEKETEGEDVED